MTVEQVLNMFAPNRLVIHNQLVLVSSWDPEEAAYWSKQGAHVNQFYSERELQRASNKSLSQGWEIGLLGACQPVIQTKLTGEEENVTRGTLVAQARKRRQEAGL